MNEEQEKNVSSLENAQLLEPIAQYVAAAIPKSISDNLSQFWRSIPAGAFVTVYKALPPSSENVYCCMSNGDYVPHNSVLANIHQSAEICTTKDSRRFGGGAPIANELCLFAPRAVWLPLGLRAAAIGKMRADKQRALLVEITESNDDAESRRSQAVYLPDVWNERPEWSAAQLIDSLTEKAGGIRIHAKGQKEPFVFVYEIPCFVVADESISIVRHDRGFFASIVLQRCLPFYNRFRRADRLAYSVTAEGEAQYDNEGAIVRSYADGSAFFKLCRLLSVERAASESVADTLFDRFPCSETQKEKNVYERESSLGVEKNGACLAARIALMLDIGRSVPETELWSLAQSYPNSDASFANPQIVVSLSRAYALLPIARGENELRKRISDVGIDFCRRFKERATVAAKGKRCFRRKLEFASDCRVQNAYRRNARVQHVGNGNTSRSDLSRCRQACSIRNGTSVRSARTFIRRTV